MSIIFENTGKGGQIFLRNQQHIAKTVYCFAGFCGNDKYINPIFAKMEKVFFVSTLFRPQKLSPLPPKLLSASVIGVVYTVAGISVPVALLLVI